MRHILDAGPLIAALNRNDRYHRWARKTIARLGPPFHSCPEAMAEAAAMTGRPAAIVEMLQAGEIILSFDLAAQAASVLVLLRKYADRDMDLADACIVRMTELERVCRVVTLDREDFSVYRRNGRDAHSHHCAPGRTILSRDDDVTVRCPAELSMRSAWKGAAEPVQGHHRASEPPCPCVCNPTGRRLARLS